jgi:hypothetical protein
MLLPGCVQSKGALVGVAEEAAGTNCATGGTAISYGVDANSDGKLSADEVTATRYACNGAAGPPGDTGPAGAKGETGSPGSPGSTGAVGMNVVTATAEASAADCPSGGIVFMAGVDDDGDGTLDLPGELDSTAKVCNGANGSTGPAGEPATVTAVTTAGEAGNCVGAGGVKMQVGAGSPTYVCNGVAGPAGEGATVTVEAPGPNCAAGGAKVQVGAGTPTYVCGGTQGSPGVAGESATVTGVSTTGEDGNCVGVGGVKVQVGTGTATYVCNGAAGAQGVAGESATVTAVSTAGEAGNCVGVGGVKAQVGTGTATYVCNGAGGAQGAQGVAGESATVTGVSTAGEAGNCVGVGGVRVQVGTGTAAYVCNGATGAQGAQGTPGVAGESATVTAVTTAGDAGNCQGVGGVKVQVGTGTAAYVCNGAAGVQGTQGVAGESATMSTVTTAGEAGNCVNVGGVKVQVGSGTATYVCNGAVGAQGAQGAAGESVTVTAVTTAGDNGNCVNVGGVKVQVGTGTAAYVCNGAVGAQGTQGVAGESATVTAVTTAGDAGNCVNVGGVKVQVGTGAATYVCNGAQGMQGPAGESATVTAVTTAGDAGNCVGVGGVKVQVGTGTATYVCNGAAGANGTNGANGYSALVTKVESYVSTASCPYGKVTTSVGVDDGAGVPAQARNGTLEPAEVDSSFWGCLEDDQDGDGIPFALDNCKSVANANQLDNDQDGTGDLCDASPCANGKSDCDATAAVDCVDVQSDVSNCGGCGITCNAGYTCFNGTCAAPPPSSASTKTLTGFSATNAVYLSADRLTMFVGDWASTFPAGKVHIFKRVLPYEPFTLQQVLTDPQLGRVNGLSVSADGNTLATMSEWTHCGIVMTRSVNTWTKSGVIGTCGSPGSTNTTLSSPKVVTVNASGTRVYVGDVTNGRIVIWKLNAGTWAYDSQMGVMGGGGQCGAVTLPTNKTCPNGLFVNSDDTKLYVCNGASFGLQTWSWNGSAWVNAGAGPTNTAVPGGGDGCWVDTATENVFVRSFGSTDIKMTNFSTGTSWTTLAAPVPAVSPVALSVRGFNPTNPNLASWAFVNGFTAKVELYGQFYP